MSLRFVEALGKINNKEEGRPRAFYFLQQWSMFFPILSIYGEGENGQHGIELEIENTKEKQKERERERHTCFKKSVTCGTIKMGRMACYRSQV